MYSFIIVFGKPICYVFNYMRAYILTVHVKLFFKIAFCWLILILTFTNPLLSVQHLIDPITNQWDDQMLYDPVDQQDHALIRKIFISSITVFLITKIWPYTRDGNFTVKTGYHFIINRSTYLMDRSPP